MEEYNKTFARAASGGNVRILKQMLKKGVDLNRCDSDGKTALMLALENAHDQAMPVSNEGDDLTRTAQTCKPEAVNLLIQAGADVNGYYYPWEKMPLWYAVKYNCVQCVSLLMDAGADVKAKYGQYDLLCLASYKGHYQCLNLLIQAVDDDIKAYSKALGFAAAGGKVKCVSLLINAGVDVNSPSLYQETPLMFAVKNDNVECASVLIEAGADVNGIPILKFACSLAVTRLLLRSGVKINRLWRSVSNVGKPVAKLLLAAGDTCMTFSYLLPEADDLMGMCRDTIRKHLLDLDWYTHLFARVERLGLPSALVRYMVFDQSLDDDNSLKC